MNFLIIESTRIDDFIRAIQAASTLKKEILIYLCQDGLFIFQNEFEMDDLTIIHKRSFASYFFKDFFNDIHKNEELEDQLRVRQKDYFLFYIDLQDLITSINGQKSQIKKIILKVGYKSIREREPKQPILIADVVFVNGCYELCQKVQFIEESIVIKKLKMDLINRLYNKNNRIDEIKLFTLSKDSMGDLKEISKTDSIKLQLFNDRVQLQPQLNNKNMTISFSDINHYDYQELKSRRVNYDSIILEPNFFNQYTSLGQKAMTENTIYLAASGDNQQRMIMLELRNKNNWVIVHKASAILFEQEANIVKDEMTKQDQFDDDIYEVIRDKEEMIYQTTQSRDPIHKKIKLNK